MKKSLALLFALGILFSGCKNNAEEIAPNRLLDGTFAGQITVETYEWDGSKTSKFDENTYPLFLSIDGNKFERADCGCAGDASIDEAAGTVRFSTSQEDCLTNWVIRPFKYIFKDGSTKLLFADDLDQRVNEFRSANKQGAFFVVRISAEKTGF
jgi:hypothetical protein